MDGFGFGLSDRRFRHLMLFELNVRLFLFFFPPAQSSVFNKIQKVLKNKKKQKKKNLFTEKQKNSQPREAKVKMILRLRSSGFNR